MRITEAGVAVVGDVVIPATMKLTITDGQLVVARGRTLTNLGAIDLFAGNVVTQKGGVFENVGGLNGAGVLRIACGGEVSGVVGSGVTVEEGACLDDCQNEGFDQAAGTAVANGEGFEVDVVNNNPAHPQTGIVFDSANPTGGDFDLQTPGSGAGNINALGGILIIAENDIDADGDGLVDDPDDEGAGGTITLKACNGAKQWEGITLIDIEEQGAVIELYDSGVLVHTSAIISSTDNSVQRVDLTGTPEANDLVVYLPSSGAIDDVRSCPSMN